MRLQIKNVRISLRHELSLAAAVRHKLGLGQSSLGEIKIAHRAVDARKQDDIYLNYQLVAEVDATAAQLRRMLHYKDVSACEEQPEQPPELGSVPMAAPPVVVGAGPAGLFAALELARYGYQPLLLERGKALDERLRDVERFWRTGALDPASNVQFGEGGAGTFSDGKLTTRVNDPAGRQILRELVAAGAPETILWEHKPHVGTDKLRSVVRGLGSRIRSLGGSICYGAQLTGLVMNNGRVTGVQLTDGSTLAVGAVVLACGHSARDTFQELNRAGVALAAKPFAIGLRIEHPQELIDRAQYGSFAGHRLLGAADYALAYHAPDGRSAYSFCMCPGGLVVGAASESGGLVVNGMSMYARDSGLANSALVVNVSSEDFGSGPLDGVAFQRRYEQLAFTAGGGTYHAPAQNLASFLHGGVPTLAGLVAPSCRPGVTACALSRLLPPYVIATLRAGLEDFGRKLAGFDDGGALLTGVETRTSSPVRIVRDKVSYVSVSHDLLYPCGEGAGYAGGIMSAALDGYHVARALMRRFAPPAPQF